MIPSQLRCLDAYSLCSLKVFPTIEKNIILLDKFMYIYIYIIYLYSDQATGNGHPLDDGDHSGLGNFLDDFPDLIPKLPNTESEDFFWTLKTYPKDLLRRYLEG